ncbi:HIT domain-containing protein [bacterium]|nr:HIT domain-containing protein [bacterium]
MKNVIFTPWRMEYILSDKTGPCVFCKVLAEDDDKQNLILLRGHHSFVIMNLYPYNNGHLMIVPNNHHASLHDLNEQTLIEMMKLLASSESMLKELMSPDGFNIGINIGEAAGAGIREHVHIHIVPRWCGDTNFFTTLSETKAVPESLKDTYDKLSPSFNKLDLS